LMPNPTSGSLEVRVSENTASGLLQVVSVDGRVVMQQRMEGPRTVLDVAQLSRGLYMLNWHDVNGTITTQRFIKE
ncbi:MAG: T9SS type A sorting domain-containing protein, partial [Flavobacteriales bacterium]